MHGQRGAAAWCGRLLLFAALLLGIVTMHTLGHPAEHTATATPSHGPVLDAGGHAAHEPGPLSAAMHGGSMADSPTAAAPAHAGMDPMSVCLAVLGVWIVGLLIGLAARDRRAHGTAAAPRSRLAGALWPIPPPPRHKALARLSVLRV
ncbi:hypothetical protein AB0I22_23350 [Streptomyces sp. NPDC050610]|uniref:hypothetical protein n=1 Tax=Streptomyces sp. NPDC050610 TaxID=3157097 RepID=UPI0034148B97